MARNFHSVSYRHEGKVRLELAGDMDGSVAAEVCYRIQTLGVQECTLDFSQVKAIGLFGARVLARGLKGLRNRGIRFEVEGLSERVAKQLCLGGALEALV